MALEQTQNRVFGAEVEKELKWIGFPREQRRFFALTAIDNLIDAALGLDYALDIWPKMKAG